MNKGLKISLIVLVIAILAGLAFWYPKYKKEKAQQKAEQQAKLTNSTILALGEDLFKNHDCSKVVTDANAYLAANPANEEILNQLGACQFSLGQFDASKATFQKALALDSHDAVAANYIKMMQVKPGQTFITTTQSPVSQSDFETAIAVKLTNPFIFENAAKYPSNDSAYLAATYTSSVNYKQSLTALKGQLTQAGFKFGAQNTGEGAIITTNQKTIFLTVSSVEQKFFSVSTTSTTTIISITYDKK